MSKSDEHDRYRVKSLVGFDEMAEGVLARSTMHADYVDHFFVDVDTAAAPERYARVMFGDVPSVAERFIWQGLLQLRLIAGQRDRPRPTKYSTEWPSASSGAATFSATARVAALCILTAVVLQPHRNSSPRKRMA